MQRIILLVLAIAIVGIGSFYMLRGGEELTYTATVEEENAVLLVDQPTQADDYVVSYAKLAQPGYVLIHSVNPETGESEVVGTSGLLTAGEHTNVRITKRSRAGTNERAARAALRASIVADNGDGAFNAEEDTAVLVEGDESSEVVESETATNPEELTEEEIGELLEEAGYTVVEENDGITEEIAESETMEADESDEMTESEEGQAEESGMEESEEDAQEAGPAMEEGATSADEGENL